jgi:hypothetical protein
VDTIKALIDAGHYNVSDKFEKIIETFVREFVR